MQIRWKVQEPSPVKEHERTCWARQLITEATPKGEVEEAVLIFQSGSALVVVILNTEGEYEILDAVVVRRADVRVREEEK